MKVTRRYLDVITVEAWGEKWQVREGTKYLTIDKNGTVKSFEKPPKLLGEQWFSAGKSLFSFNCVGKVKGAKFWLESVTAV